jgi:hypothetical protein
MILRSITCVRKTATRRCSITILNRSSNIIVRIDGNWVRFDRLKRQHYSNVILLTGRRLISHH